ncbi:hypothetical protein LZ31DRAFT_153195 [Colletotrichum somersetense]|nr:hypothetical protein LZ31DRAFT_153195 [Colletotrichum somersetense]
MLQAANLESVWPAETASIDLQEIVNLFTWSTRVLLIHVLGNHLIVSLSPCWLLWFSMGVGRDWYRLWWGNERCKKQHHGAHFELLAEDRI